MKHTIEFNLPEERIELNEHIKAVEDNSNLYRFLEYFEQFLRSEYKHGPTKEDAHELIHHIRDTYFRLKNEYDIKDRE